MNLDRIPVLLVEDNPADARFVRELMAEARTLRFEVTHVERLDEAVRRLEAGDVSVVLLDLSLPDGRGLETVARVHAAAPDVPIVIMSGNQDEALALQGVREGAQDYLVKGRIDHDLLVRALCYAIERRRAEDALTVAREAALEAERQRAQVLEKSNAELERLGGALAESLVSLKGRTEALEAKTREQEAFIYTVSHDLRAPLIAVQGMATILVEDHATALDPDARECLDWIVASVGKMHTLLNSLLDVSRVGRDDIDRDDVDLGAIVRGVAEQSRPTLAARGGRVRIHGTLPRVRANSVRMTQVFTNLIDNAIAYTPPERAPTVDLCAIDGGAHWEILVRDNGVGIPSAFRDKVFDIFRRLPDGKAANPHGSGVGLAIVARIMQTHSGAVWIESEEGAGTTFHLTLPKGAAEGGGNQGVQRPDPIGHPSLWLERSSA